MDPYDWQIVRSTPLFGAMPQEVTQSIIGNQAVRSYEKGFALFQQGEPAGSFFVVLDGWVKLFRMTPDGSEAVVGVFRRGETFAEAAIFLGGRYPTPEQTRAVAEALVHGKAICIQGGDYRVGQHCQHCGQWSIQESGDPAAECCTCQSPEDDDSPPETEK